MSLLAAPASQSCRSCWSISQHLLARSVLGVPEGQPQRLTALRQEGDGAAQGGEVHLLVEVVPHRQIGLRLRLAHLVFQQQPLLDVPQFAPLLASLSCDAVLPGRLGGLGGRTGRRSRVLREVGDGEMGEEAGDRQLHAERLLEAVGGPQGEQRVAAEAEETGEHVDPTDAGLGGPQGPEHALHVTVRAVGAAGEEYVRGRGQRRGGLVCGRRRPCGEGLADLLGQT